MTKATRDHKPHWITSGVVEHNVRCTRCGWVPKGGPFQTAQMAQDEWDRHIRDMDRVNAHLLARKGTPSLKATATYYRSMADNVEIPAAERAEWDRLAVEVERRLGHAPSVEEEPELPLGL